MILLTLTEILAVQYVGGPEGEQIPVCIGPAFENDNQSLSARNALVSVCLCHVAGSWIVSAFRIGADGEPDTDNGEIFVKEFERETRARWLYRGCVAKLVAK